MIQARLQISGQISEREKLTGGLNATIKEIKPELENINIEPSVEQQILKSEKYGYGEVIINPVTSNIDEEIKPENIKVGINILGVEGGYKGIDTSDATVNPNQILEGQTAYVNGQKIEGTMPNNGELTFVPSDEQQVIPSGYTEGGYINPANIETLKDYNAYLSIADEILGMGA